jgi:hypothetical protein
MAEHMTIDEIEARFPDEWILVIDPAVGPDLSVRSGVVAAHRKNRDEVDRTAKSLKPRRSAVWFNGEPPPDVVLIPSILGIGPDDCQPGVTG